MQHRMFLVYLDGSEIPDGVMTLTDAFEYAWTRDRATLHLEPLTTLTPNKEK